LTVKNRPASEEIRYDLLSSSDGPNHLSTIRVIATDQFIHQIEQRFGAKSKVPVTRDTNPVLRGPTMSDCGGFVPDTSNSDYLWSYADIENLLTATAIQSAGQVAHLGTSFEGRDIWGIKFGPLSGGSNTPTIYIVATQHAREWAAAGTAVGLIKKLAEVVLDQTHTNRPELREALEHAAVVIVPVANPDGYEYTRTSERLWRGNRNLTDCYISGVNLNRNHRATWSVLATNTNPDCYDPYAQPGDYTGPAAASESETIAIEGLLQGDRFETSEKGILVLDYHTYADLVIYPSGFKPTTDASGPKCADYLSSNCHTADLQALRELLGDTTSHRFTPPLFVDLSHPGVTKPFWRDQSPNILYSSSGTLVDEGAYGRVPMLSATVELTDVGFSIECESAYDDIIKNAVSGQLDVVTRVLQNANPLISASRMDAYFPQQIGSLPSGFLSREYHSGVNPEQVRPSFLKAVWNAVSTGTLSGSMGGSMVNFTPLRQGVHLSLYGKEVEAAGDGALCAPCSVDTAISAYDLIGRDEIPNCSKCVDLCDSGRLVAPSAAWEMKTGSRGGIPDCWWEPTGIGDLWLPEAYAPFLATKCTFSFSITNPLFLYDGLKLFRDSPVGEELIWSLPSYYGGAPHRPTTFVFEASEFLGQGRVPHFRFEAPSLNSSQIKIFDPIVYCRVGALE
jgi:hypothetical protein